MLATFSEMVTLVSFVHPENASLPMLVTLSGIVMLVRACPWGGSAAISRVRSNLARRSNGRVLAQFAKIGPL